ncbi:hypothetical protein BJ944DRAFT_273187 [Cunninghamella echinulata]|nr:hypothetical protein BJ944DRAFT_273187 [Cunninghamella echinulata]
MKRSREVCPLCSSKIEEFPIHFNSTFTMCENTKCLYPFNTNDFMKFVHTDELKIKKKQRTTKKPTEIITIDSTQSQQNGIKHPIKSATVSSTQHNNNSNTKSTAVISQHKKSVNGKKEDVIISLPSPTKQKDLSFDLALPSKSIAKGSFVIPSSAAKPPHSAPARKPLKKASLASASKISSTVPSVHNSKELPDLPNSRNMTNTTANNYTLADLEVLLNDNEDGGSLVVTPEDTTFDMMNPMLWLDNIVQDQQQQQQQDDIKCNPLQPDQDLDFLLGFNTPL